MFSRLAGAAAGVAAGGGLLTDVPGTTPPIELAFPGVLAHIAATATAAVIPPAINQTRILTFQILLLIDSSGVIQANTDAFDLSAIPEFVLPMCRQITINDWLSCAWPSPTRPPDRTSNSPYSTAAGPPDSRPGPSSKATACA